MRRAQRGAPVIVHFWGLSCAPCLGELPRWGQLLHDRPGLHLVLVAATPRPKTRPRRGGARPGRPGVGGARAFADSFLDRLRFEVGPDWAGELPFTVLIGKDGMTTTQAGTIDLAAVRSWLAARPPPGELRGSRLSHFGGTLRQLSLQRAAVHPELPGRLRHVAATVGQYPLQVFPLHTRERRQVVGSSRGRAARPRSNAARIRSASVGLVR